MVDYERTVLEALKYKVHFSSNHYTYALSRFRQATESLDSADSTEAEQLLTFLCFFGVYSVHLPMLSESILAIALKYLVHISNSHHLSSSLALQVQELEQRAE